jgi:uncharacterized protein
MMNILYDGPDSAPCTIVLAHGAGAPMDSPAMEAITTALREHGLRIARFEFEYMAARRNALQQRKPPPRAEKLLSEYRMAVASLERGGPVIIGGKSMGGRVASMVADELHAAGTIAGLLCIGYPFHPPGKPEQLRTAHLAELKTPMLVCQGTRDPFGNREEVSGYNLSRSVEIAWFQDGDHDLRPRKKMSGLTFRDHMNSMAEIVSRWCGNKPEIAMAT